MSESSTIAIVGREQLDTVIRDTESAARELIESEKRNATLQRALAQARAEAKVNGDEAADLRRELGEAHLRIGGLMAELAELRKPFEQFQATMTSDDLTRLYNEHVALKSSQQYTCEAHRDEVKKGGSCVWCQLADAQSWEVDAKRYRWMRSKESAAMGGLWEEALDVGCVEEVMDAIVDRCMPSAPLSGEQS